MGNTPSADAQEDAALSPTSESANLLPECCPPGSEAFCPPPKDYQDLGHVVYINERLNLYITSGGKDNEYSKEIGVMMIHDVFGFLSGRHRYVADQLAQELNCLVYLPDLFHGSPLLYKDDAFSLTLSLPSLVYQLSTKYSFKQVWPDVESVMQYAAEVKNWACIGFCFGGYIVSHLVGTGKFFCGASPHPSLGVICNLTGENIPDIVKSWKCPVMMLPGGNDPAECKPGGLVEKIVQEEKTMEEECVFKEFPEMKHGWVVRGDIDDPVLARDARGAMVLISQFIKKHTPK